VVPTLDSLGVEARGNAKRESYQRAMNSNPSHALCFHS
jgi:hypothetical protein